MITASRQKKIIIVAGPNGAGKTTLMKLITTLYSLQEGDMFLNDLNYRKDLKSIRKNVNVLSINYIGIK